MLRDGQFIKEAPVKMGSMYQPKRPDYSSPEGDWVQAAYLDGSSVSSARMTNKVVALAMLAFGVIVAMFVMVNV